LNPSQQSFINRLAQAGRLRAIDKLGLMAGWQFWVDRGGTFTDIVARRPDGTLASLKRLSQNPGRYEDAALSGIREFLGVPESGPIQAGVIDTVKLGTTVATNALLERKGAPTLLLINKGFRDLLRIGTQARPRLFDLNIVLPTMLYTEVREISGRIGVDGAELEPLDEAEISAIFAAARAQKIESVAIALLHAWRFPGHEQRAGALAAAAGFENISLSHRENPLIRLLPRADTTVADAYLSPVLKTYLDKVAAGLAGTKFYIMQSSGGLQSAQGISGKDAVLSGPAGGIAGAARTAALAGFDKIIGFDMGGTSTDVALYNNEYERAFETEIAGIRLRTPMLAINTVAAGGGSILSFDGARLRAGPHSAGAYPGPA